MASHSSLIILLLFLFQLSNNPITSAQTESEYTLTFFGRRLCCDNVWANGNCPDSENDFDVGVTGATAAFRCKDRLLNTTRTDSGWFVFTFVGEKNPILKYDMVKDCSIIVTSASNSDCPGLGVPLISHVTGVPADGIMDYANNGDFSKLDQ